MPKEFVSLSCTTNGSENTSVIKVLSLSISAIKYFNRKMRDNSNSFGIEITSSKPRNKHPSRPQIIGNRKFVEISLPTDKCEEYIVKIEELFKNDSEIIIINASKDKTFSLEMYNIKFGLNLCPLS
jgi:hypothetical protein